MKTKSHDKKKNLLHTHLYIHITRIPQFYPYFLYSTNFFLGTIFSTVFVLSKFKALFAVTSKEFDVLVKNVLMAGNSPILTSG